MKLKIAWIGKTKDPSIQTLTAEYLKRISRYAEVEGLALPDEAALLKLREKVGARPAHALVLFDSRGKQLSSEEFTQFLQNHLERNPGTSHKINGERALEQQIYYNLRQNLQEQGYNLDKIPYVVQYNKRDLPNSAPLEELKKLLNPTNVPEFEAVAVTGVGVFDTLKAVAKLVLTELKRGG